MCQFCKCENMRDSFTTHVVDYKSSIIIVKNVPCIECDRCGEKYYTDEIAAQLEKLVDAAKQLMQEISVIDYKNVA